MSRLTEAKRREAERLSVALADLLGQIERDEAIYARFPEADPYVDGDVLTFERTFNGGTHLYSYAWLRSNGRWYGTGPKQRDPIPWSLLVHTHLIHAESVHRVTEYEQEF